MKPARHLALRITVAVQSLLMGLFPVSACATDPPGEPGPASQPSGSAQKSDEASKPWTVSGGIDYLTQYIYRGYVVNSSGWIVQPTLDFALTAYESEVLSIRPHVGLWGSFTEEKGPGNPQHWSEGDVTAGANIEFHRFEFSANYQYQSYPNDSQGDVQELQLGVWYDDEALWAEHKLINGLYPGMNCVRELSDTADGDENTYFDLTLEPTAQPWTPLGDEFPITLAFPMVLGMSLDGYYTDADGHNEALGYYSIGAKITLPVTCADKSIGGSWMLVLSVDYVRMLADSTIEANGGDDDDFAGRIGFTFEF